MKFRINLTDVCTFGYMWPACMRNWCVCIFTRVSVKHWKISDNFLLIFLKNTQTHTLSLCSSTCYSSSRVFFLVLICVCAMLILNDLMIRCECVNWNWSCQPWATSDLSQTKPVCESLFVFVFVAVCCSTHTIFSSQKFSLLFIPQTNTYNWLFSFCDRRVECFKLNIFSVVYFFRVFDSFVVAHTINRCSWITHSSLSLAFCLLFVPSNWIWFYCSARTR